jgi:macrodomain Ter protein organizer (MatP/YcbG family)
MTREKHLRLRLNELEWKKLQREAERRQITVSELVRDLIKQLPENKEDLTKQSLP